MSNLKNSITHIIIVIIVVIVYNFMSNNKINLIDNKILFDTIVSELCWCLFFSLSDSPFHVPHLGTGSDGVLEICQCLVVLFVCCDS